MLDDILFYGDPHGEYGPLIEAVRQRTPEAVIILGDFDADEPLEKLLAPVITEVGRERIWWIPGNHDTDSPERYDNLFASALADRNLHGKVEEIAGLRIAGLGGVFRGQVWYPREADAKVKVWSRDEYVGRLPKGHRWRDGLPLKHRSTIFPEDIAKLGSQACDILVTHEGSVMAEFGFEAIDNLARRMGASAIVHGHLHVDYAIEANGIMSVGCAERQAKWGSELGLSLAPAGPAPR